jgi:hypothetical protein
MRMLLLPDMFSQATSGDAGTHHHIEMSQPPPQPPPPIEKAMWSTDGSQLIVTLPAGRHLDSCSGVLLQLNGVLLPAYCTDSLQAVPINNSTRLYTISNLGTIRPLLDGAQLQPCEAVDGDEREGDEWSLVIRAVWPQAGAGHKVGRVGRGTSAITQHRATRGQQLSRHQSRRHNRQPDTPYVTHLV